MTLVFLDQGEAIALDYLVNRDGPENLVLRLFKNDVTDGLTAAQIEALTEADFTEANFTGYSAATLTGANWTTTEGDPTATVYAQQTFQSAADQTAQDIHGYYYTRSSGGEAVAFEEFAAPITVAFNGERIKITPRITAKDEQD